MAHAGFILLVSLSCFIVLMQVMQMAAGLSGGLSLSTMNVVAGVTRRGASSMRSTASWASNKGAKFGAGARARAYINQAWGRSGGSISKK